MPFLPVVDSCEFAILHQLVPEVGQALSGEDLFRVGLMSRKSQNRKPVLCICMIIGIGIGIGKVKKEDLSYVLVLVKLV